MVLKALQNRLDTIRTRIVDSNKPLDDSDRLISLTSEDIEEEIVLLATPRLKKVINATGVILHTNLGRSLLPHEVLNHLVTIADSYSNLEYDVEEGSRGSRCVVSPRLRPIGKIGCLEENAVKVQAKQAVLVLDSISKIAYVCGVKLRVGEGEVEEILVLLQCVRDIPAFHLGCFPKRTVGQVKPF